MVIGTIKEVKDNENRIGLTPYGVKELVAAGHKVLVQKGGGVGAGFSDEEYMEAGAEMIEGPEGVVTACEILVKVKEPVASEFPLLDKFKGKTLYTYLHLSGVDKNLTLNLVKNEIAAVAYETVEDQHGELPLLAPMSEVAGVLAVQYGAQYLQKKYKGRGVSLGVIHGADPAETVVIGGGFVGATSAKTAAGMGGKVTIVNRSMPRLERLKDEFRGYLGDKLLGNVSFVQLTDESLREAVLKADLLIGAVLVPGTKAPEVVSEDMVKSMKEGAVVVDVSIDQGGCIWGAKPTSHSEPIYEVDGKIFCCITNMPGQVARQSTQALTYATLPYLKLMAEKGIEAAARESVDSDGRFARGLNTYKGKIVYKAVAEDLDLMSDYADLKEVL